MLTDVSTAIFVEVYYFILSYSKLSTVLGCAGSDGPEGRDWDAGQPG